MGATQAAPRQPHPRSELAGEVSRPTCAAAYWLSCLKSWLTNPRLTVARYSTAHLHFIGLARRQHLGKHGSDAQLQATQAREWAGEGQAEVGPRGGQETRRRPASRGGHTHPIQARPAPAYSAQQQGARNHCTQGEQRLVSATMGLMRQGRPPGRQWRARCASCRRSAARSACPSGAAPPPRPCVKRMGVGAHAFHGANSCMLERSKRQRRGCCTMARASSPPPAATTISDAQQPPPHAMRSNLHHTP